jgi:FMN phosphatase YigB (HAD superfamily)
VKRCGGITLNKQKIVLLDIDYTIFDTDLLKNSNLQKFALFAEVRNTLLDLSKVASLGIFSEGDIAFQRRKLEETNILEHFMEEHTHIVERKSVVIKEMLDKYKNKGQLFLVDDKMSILAMAKQYMPKVFTIWVKRGIYANIQQPIENYTPDAVVETLENIVPLIASQ